MALLYHTDGRIEYVTPKNGRRFSTKELQEAVGGYIEMTPISGSNDLFVVNEEGKLLDLEYNRKATEAMLYNKTDYIVGDALRCKRSELN